ncbi:chemerin-like receptor 2 [Nothobranchius furzeri]|uniref:Chemerin chemokine-like receptor 2 n=2 Tax=Nothobranchius furzeri TaxID=105023 RepID=A0A1A8AAP5_NOTFU|nr:chemerin-like receptor 2 [Nothobranchius furzeri]KAF7215800.1 G protein-coupled receptor 1 [Nothobranchius furzeri]
MGDSGEDYTGEDYNYTYACNLEYEDLGKLKVGHQQSEPIHIISVVVYIISIMLGLIGNGMVIWVMAFKIKKTTNSVWLLNLAIADFVFVLFLPFYIDYILRDFHWDFGLAMCKINSFVSVMNMYASVLFLTVLSVDRYVSLVHLNWSRRHRTVHRAWLMCGCIWAMAALLSCPALIFRDTLRLHDHVLCYNNFHMQNGYKAAMIHITIVTIRTTVGFLLPLTAISVTGILLSIKVRNSGGSVHMSSFSKTVTAVILAFFLCWAPFHAFSLMELSIHSSVYLHHILKSGFPLATSLGFFNSCINPLLYILLGKKVRHILKSACLNVTKSSLRELSQSISATEIESVPGTHLDSSPDDYLTSSTL